jgi:hypothetical protein
MSSLSECTVFFDESTLVADEWVLEQVGNAARRLVPCDSDQHIFIKLDHLMDSQFFFLLIVGPSPNEPQCMWKATVIDESTDPQFENLSMEQ